MTSISTRLPLLPLASVIMAGCGALGQPATTGPEVSPASSIPASLISPASPIWTVGQSSALPAPTLQPSDIERLELTVEDLGPGDWLSRDEAIDVAWSVYRQPDPEVALSASLYRVTDPKTLGASPEVDARPVWIIKFDGIEDQAPVPVRSGGAAPEVITLTRAYTFVDAATGEWLYRQTTE